MATAMSPSRLRQSGPSSRPEASVKSVFLKMQRIRLSLHLFFTEQDDHVWLGSIGFEWYGKSGEIVHRNAEWARDPRNPRRGVQAIQGAANAR